MMDQREHQSEMLWDPSEQVMFLIYWNQKEKLEDLDDLIFISKMYIN